MFIIDVSLTLVRLLKYPVRILASTAEVTSALKTSSQQSERICTVKQLTQSTCCPLGSHGVGELHLTSFYPEKKSSSGHLIQLRV